MHTCIQKYLIQYVSEKSKPLESFNKYIKHLGTQEDPDIMLIISDIKVYIHTRIILGQSQRAGCHLPPPTFPTSHWYLLQVVPLTPYRVPPASMYSAHELTAQFTPHLFISLSVFYGSDFRDTNVSLTWLMSSGNIQFSSAGTDAAFQGTSGSVWRQVFGCHN